MTSEAEKKKVWVKADKIKGKKPDVARKDAYGNEIHYNDYGTNRKFSWDIDHIKPVSKKGPNTLANKQPLQSKENRKKADKTNYRKPKKK